MPAEVNRIQELHQDTFIDLFEVSGYNPDSPFDAFRFTNHSGVQFGCKAYRPIPCHIVLIDYDSQMLILRLFYLKLISLLLDESSIRLGKLLSLH